MDLNLIKWSQNSPPDLVRRFKQLVMYKLWPGTHIRAEDVKLFQNKIWGGSSEVQSLLWKIIRARVERQKNSSRSKFIIYSAENKVELQYSFVD